MKATKKVIDKWQSKNCKVSASGSHPGMYIVDFPDGKFYAINASFEHMVNVHPIVNVLQ